MRYASYQALIILTTLLTLPLNLSEGNWPNTGIAGKNNSISFVQAITSSTLQQTTPLPTEDTPQVTPEIKSQVSSTGIILVAIIAVLIVIVGVIWHGLTNPSIRR